LASIKRLLEKSNIKPKGENIMKNFIKKTLQPMRPYVLGEDLTGISVWDGDTPEEGGMIAVNPKNPEDTWYVAKKFFEENYMEAPERPPGDYYTS